MRDRSLEALQHRAGGLTLLTAAMRADGEAVPDAMPPFLSPLGWQHITLTGEYIRAAGSASPEAGNVAPNSEGAPAVA